MYRTKDLLATDNATLDEAQSLCQRMSASSDCVEVMTRRLKVLVTSIRATMQKRGLIDRKDHVRADVCLQRATDDAWVLAANAQHASNYSQGGQDGVLRYIFRHIGVTNKHFVEFGFNSYTYEGGTGSNTYNLYKHDGWRGLLLDGHYENASINLHKEWITPMNIVSLFRKYAVPLIPDFVSIDVDSTDLWLMKAILTEYSPRVLSVEYNSNYPLGYAVTCDTRCQWTPGSRVFGAAYSALRLVGLEFNYSVVAVVIPFDVVFVRNDLLVGADIPEFTNDDIYLETHHATGSTSIKEYAEEHLLDYSPFVETHEDQAKQAVIKLLAELQLKGIRIY